MAKVTYKSIQEEFLKEFGSTIKTCWIADIKRKNGLEVKTSGRRIDPFSIKNFCPSNKEEKLHYILKKLKVL